MTVGVLVETVFIRVNGFSPSTDNVVMRADIRAMLPAAVNFAMDRAERINRSEEDEFPSEFYGVYTDVPINQSGPVPFVNLTHKTPPLFNGEGIRRVYDNCGTEYNRLSGNDMGSVKYYEGLAVCMKWYRRVSNRLNLYGDVSQAETLNYEALVDINDLGDEDEAPIQAGLEPMVLDLLTRWFTKEAYYDSVIDTRDINSAN